MKVLSLREPYASLIMNKKKLVETRSFKTNYRGILYIHTSKTKISKDVLNNSDLMKLVDLDNLNFGKIICKCDLVDCVYMTKEYIESLRKNNYQEYICGFYEEGRYAWILDNIVPLDNKINAKGQLGIWNYDNN